MKRKLIIEEWPRKDHFHFFRQFEEPFFGLTVTVDATIAYHRSKELQTSFFLYYLHKSLAAANAVEAFRYRIDGEDVLVYDRIDASPTINRENGTFGFSYMRFYEDYELFARHAQAEIARVRATSGLEPATSSENVIHYSALPWLPFTAFSHARAYSFADSIPKMAFGKLSEADGHIHLPVSVHVHHALVDGLHVGQFIEHFQEQLDG